MKKHLVSIVLLCGLGLHSLSYATPVILDARIKSVEKFAEKLGNTMAHDILINDGTNGFPRGLLVSSGPGGTVSREVFHISEAGIVTNFVDGLSAAMGIGFGPGGAFGTDLYVSETRFPRVIRVDSAGSVSSFATGFATPFGPEDLVFGPGGAFGTDLFIAELSGNRIVTVDPSGSIATFATVQRPQAVQFDSTGRFGGNLFTTTFVGFTGNPGDDVIWEVDPLGNVSPFITGLTGVELITFGPGGIFGDDMFFATLGQLDVNADGFVSYADPSGNVHPFLGGIDATSIVFDDNNVLGGGIFVVEGINGEPDPVDNNWTIWRVTMVPEPSSFLLFSTGFLAFVLRGRRLS